MNNIAVVRSDGREHCDNKIKKVWSVNEWGTLHEIILGDPNNAYLPNMEDPSQLSFDRYSKEELARVVASNMPQKVLEETLEDIEGLTNILNEYGVSVKRAKQINMQCSVESPYWQADQESALNIRDLTLIHGDLAIDSASPTRGRYFEGFAVRELLLDYYSKRNYSGLLCPPRPQLFDNTYDLARERGIAEIEPLFDAANCVRMGHDIIIDINNTANMAGAKWLQSTLNGYFGKGIIKVHPVSLSPDHIDIVIVPLCEGHALINPDYVTSDNLPSFLYKWNLIESPKMVSQSYFTGVPKATNWIGMNLLVLDGKEKTVLVAENQPPLIKCLEDNGFHPIPVPWRHARSWGGGFHCISLDLHRDGEL